MSILEQTIRSKKLKPVGEAYRSMNDISSNAMQTQMSLQHHRQQTRTMSSLYDNSAAGLALKAGVGVGGTGILTAGGDADPEQLPRQSLLMHVRKLRRPSVIEKPTPLQVEEVEETEDAGASRERSATDRARDILAKRNFNFPKKKNRLDKLRPQRVPPPTPTATSPTAATTTRTSGPPVPAFVAGAPVVEVVKSTSPDEARKRRNLSLKKLLGRADPCDMPDAKPLSLQSGVGVNLHSYVNMGTRGQRAETDMSSFNASSSRISPSMRQLASKQQLFSPKGTRTNRAVTERQRPGSSSGGRGQDGDDNDWDSAVESRGRTPSLQDLGRTIERERASSFTGTRTAGSVVSVAGRKSVLDTRKSDLFAELSLGSGGSSSSSHISSLQRQTSDDAFATSQDDQDLTSSDEST